MIALTPLLALLRPLLPYILAAVAVLAMLGGIWLSGERHAEQKAEQAQATHQIEVLKQEKAGDEAATDARRDGADGRLRDGQF